MILSMLRNQKGIAILSVYTASAFISVLSISAFGRAFWEARHVDQEVTRIKSYAAAEAGLQRALAQVAQNAYTGFINTNAISQPTFQSSYGDTVGSYTVSIQYPNAADWVIITSTGTVNGEIRRLEGRVFLDSNLSKYLVYADTGTFSSGTGASYGESNGVDPMGVPANEDDRTMMYFTGNWSITGGGVALYGDSLVEGSISGHSGSNVYGDTYVQAFTKNAQGQVTNSGVSGNMPVGDGFSDDSDRNNDGVINSTDRPDMHDLTNDGDDDSKAKETLVAMDLNFYATNSNINTFATGAATNRYLKFEPVSGGNNTRVIEYTSTNYSTVKATYNLPSTAIVYVKGDAYVKGQIQGRISIAASDDIHFMGDVSYAGGQTHASPSNSVAFLAKDILYLKPDNLDVSGIMYAENSSNASAAFDAGYDLNGNVDTSKTELNLYGNRVIQGGTNLSYYGDRLYGYDQNLKYYRPPGIPVYPDLRTVRET